MHVGAGRRLEVDPRVVPSVRGERVEPLAVRRPDLGVDGEPQRTEQRGRVGGAGLRDGEGGADRVGAEPRIGELCEQRDAGAECVGHRGGGGRGGLLRVGQCDPLRGERRLDRVALRADASSARPCGPVPRFHDLRSHPPRRSTISTSASSGALA